MERDCMEDLALAILLAQDLHDESFNEDTLTYSVSQNEAADKAGSKLGFDKRATQVIFLLNTCCWNNIQSWAEDILKETSNQKTD